MTLTELHNNIKDLIKGKGFRYVPAEKWFNLDLGVIPAALINNGFNVQPAESRGTETEDADSVTVTFKVEFMLDPKNDLYLQKMTGAIDAVKLLQFADVLNGDDVLNYVEWQSYALSNAGEFMALTFNQICFEI